MRASALFLLCFGPVSWATADGDKDPSGPDLLPPTHPELPDWLAVELMDNGWSMKRLTFKYQGREFRLTDVHGKVVHDLLA